MSEIVNRVASSPIITVDLEKLYLPGERMVFDLKPYLFQELVLKEKDFRQSLKDTDWINYSGKYVAVTCSVEAIIPTWAYMLVVTYLEGVAKDVVIGDLEVLEQHLIKKTIATMDVEVFIDRPVVVKGCSKFPVPLYAYGELVKILKQKARSIMFGEPCSTVPLYKKPKDK